jgi:mRNA-degrading endonuclease YafQ of YafQ-DinJ toxin-antitoxin module
VSNKPIWLINKIKEKYSDKFSEDLEENIKNNIKDENIQNLILILLNSEKDDNKEFNIEESKNQAKELFEAEDEEITEIFYNIIKNSSQKELSIIVREYHKLSNKTILDFIKENIPNEIQNYVNSLVFLIISPSEYFAKRINSIIKDLNNDIKINLLIRILVSRSELDLTQIIHYYKALFNKEIIDDIKENINSDYQMALIELCSH